MVSDRIKQELDSGIQHYHLGDLQAAESCFRNVLQWQQDNADAWHLLGVIATQQRNYSTAIERINHAIKLKSTDINFHINLGNIFQETGQLERAISSYQQVIQLDSSALDAHYNLGLALQKQGNLEAAIASYQQVIQLNPDYDSAHINLGIALKEQGKLENAISSYRQALKLRPDHPIAHQHLGIALKSQGKLDEAISSDQQTQKLKPDHQAALAQYVWAGRLICNWEGLAPLEQALILGAHSVELVTTPFPLLAISDDPAVQLASAQNYCASTVGHPSSLLWEGQQYTHDKIRLAYLSADYHEHATAYLMAELFERHDRSRFELFAISFGPERQDSMHQRLVQAFDHFIDVHQMSDREAAQQIRDLEIEIAVDLKGYTKDCRPQILAHRPAPIQVNYLGYPSTMGADFIDYILVDPFIVPPDRQPYFTEKLVHLPGCYQVNGAQRVIAEHLPTRAACGLPPEGFVFCSFNNAYKITPTVFDLWMRLLNAIPGSVLWLLSRNNSTQANLRREAQARDVNSDRLIFAPVQDLPEHLARQQLADLFLDTFPCNAHTTASDALWVGLPVLTCAGQSFVARVAGSLLHTIGLPELVVSNLEDYEAMALKLATQPELLGKIKAKLQQNRLETPLFDCDRCRRHLEAAYIEMWSIWQREEKPRAFAVHPLES
jgi:predicted O-linked N-acetylglucosamine transferase (SPINDLY family)